MGENINNVWLKKNFSELFNFEKKSKNKARDGKEFGKYKFFTSSITQDKYIDEFEFQNESLIFGTGGKPSIHYCNDKFSTTADCFVTHRKKNNIITKYVYYYFKSNMQLLEAGFKGIALKHLSKNYLNGIEITFPESIEIQNKIVDILEKIEKIKIHREKINILTENFLNSAFHSMFLENDYEKNILMDFTELISSGSTPKGGSDNYLNEGEILFIRSQNVLMNKFSNHDSLYLPIKIHENMKRTWVHKNDVLLNITGASIGRTAVYKGESNKANVNQHVAIIRLKNFDKLNPVYLNYYLSSEPLQKHIIKINSGATRQALNFTQIGKFEILVPPIELQNNFVEIVEKIEKLKQYQNQSKIEIDNLFNNLMQKAFKGELLS